MDGDRTNEDTVIIVLPIVFFPFKVFSEPDWYITYLRENQPNLYGVGLRELTIPKQGLPSSFLTADASGPFRTVTAVFRLIWTRLS